MTDEVCPRCGASLDQPPTEVMVCPRCAVPLTRESGAVRILTGAELRELPPETHEAVLLAMAAVAGMRRRRLVP